VVEVNEEGWLDGAGHTRGQSMYITERFHRRDFGISISKSHSKMQSITRGLSHLPSPASVIPL